MIKWERFLSLPVLCVILSSCIVYYVTVFIIIDPFLSLKTSPGILNAFIITVLALLFKLSFFVCVLTDPGRVPPGFVPDLEHDPHHDNNNNSAKSGVVQQKNCDKCSAYKPPRTHHCRSCQCCILRMDHHCSWINNCVGHRNYKAFFLLVLYATAASFYSSVAVVCFSLHKDWSATGYIALKFIYITSIVALSLTLGTLLGWHIYLVLHNMTTIEYYEGVKSAWLAKKSGQSYRHPFDVGVYKNITLVLGPNMLKWLWPMASSHIKDGITFPTIRDSS